MNPGDQLARWQASKARIARCTDCQAHGSVGRALTAEEIPDPIRGISILFVGVAPPPAGVDDGDGGHFYTNVCDRLRIGLFRVLDRVFGCRLLLANQSGRDAGTKAFLDEGFFFVHAAKVPPLGGRLTPNRTVMRECAKQHLAEEIRILQARAVCFLGATNARPAAAAVFGAEISDEPAIQSLPRVRDLDAWRGWASLTVQPVRGTKERGDNIERVITAVKLVKTRLATASN